MQAFYIIRNIISHDAQPHSEVPCYGIKFFKLLSMENQHGFRFLETMVTDTHDALIDKYNYKIEAVHPMEILTFILSRFCFIRT